MLRPAETTGIVLAGPSPADVCAPAGLLRRLGALCYDGLLILALWMVTLLLMVVANGGEPVFGAAVQALLFLEMATFFAYFLCAAGQTAGMRAWRLHLVANEGGPVTLNQAMVRLFVAMLSIAVLGLGYLWALAHPERKTWPDLASNTSVLHRPP